MEIIAGALLLATFTEGLINYLFGENSTSVPRTWIKYIALGFGVAVALLFSVDIFALAGLTAIHPLVGQVATGLVIGRGSNYVNDFVSLFNRS